MTKKICSRFLNLAVVGLCVLRCVDVSGQTITTGALTDNGFCSGSYISIPYTVTGVFNTGNIFTAQLSDTAGSFASPVNIGSLVSTVSGTIEGTLPTGTLSGNAYKIRVTGSGPATVGSTSPTNVIINHTPEPTFQKTYSTGSGVSILSGKVTLLRDSTYAFTSYGMNLFHTDAEGNFLWTKGMYESHNYGYPYDYSDFADNVRQTFDGGFIVGGHEIYSDSAGFNQYCMLLVKTDASGNCLWSVAYGNADEGGCSGTIGTFLNTVKQTSDSGYILTGYTTDFGFGCYGHDIIIKLDANGNQLWTRTLDDIQVNYVYGWGAADIVEITGGGGDLMIYAGNYPNPNPTRFAALIRIHADGTIVWSKQFTISSNIVSTSIVETPGGYYLGSTNGYGVVKVDTGGNVLWSNTYTYSGGSYESSLTASADSGCVLTGYAYVGNNETVEMVKVSPSGAVEWAYNYGSGIGETVTQTPDGGYLEGGNEGSGTMYLIKTDSLGNSGGNQSAATVTVNPAPPVNAAYTPVYTARTATLLPTCMVYSNVTTQVNILVGGTGQCNGYEPALTGNSCSAQASFSASPVAVCAGGTVAFTGIYPGVATGWRWTFTGGTPDTSSSQNPVITYTTPGSYPVKLVVSSSSGTDSDVQNSYITVLPVPVAGNITSPDSAVCAGARVSLLDTGFTTGNLQWQWGDSATGFNNITGADSAGYATTVLNNMYFRVVNTNSYCADTSAPLAIQAYPVPAPPVIATDDSLICASDSALITSSGSYASYHWNNGDTLPSIYTNTAGPYGLTVSNTYGCTAQSNGVSISVYPVPSVSIVQQGDTLSSFGQVAYQWIRNSQILPGDTGSFYLARQPGSYAVQVTDTNGCTTISQAVVVTGVENLTEQNISVYPNPSVGSWQLTVENELLGSNLEIYDDNGRLVFKSKIRNLQSKINLDVASGVYYLRISSPNVSVVRKLVKL